MFMSRLNMFKKMCVFIIGGCAFITCSRDHVSRFQTYFRCDAAPGPRATRKYSELVIGGAQLLSFSSIKFDDKKILIAMRWCVYN